MLIKIITDKYFEWTENLRKTIKKLEEKRKWIVAIGSGGYHRQSRLKKNDDRIGIVSTRPQTARQLLRHSEDRQKRLTERQKMR